MSDSGPIVGVAIVATAFAVGGLVVWYINNELANTLNDLAGATQALTTAHEALVIGVVAAIIAALAWFMVLGDP